MGKFLLRWGINAIALYVAIAIMNGNGINPQSTKWLSFIWLALIFGLVNAIIRPVLAVLTCPLIILTLGFGTLLLNTLMFYLAGVIGQSFHVGFTVDGFIPTFLGALIVTVISIILDLVVKDEFKHRKK
jgi:putative membrane protein